MGPRIDRESRDACVQAIRAYVANRIDADELVLSWPHSRRESGVNEIGDWIESLLAGGKLVKDWPAAQAADRQEMLHRCLLFLASDRPYQWPQTYHSLPLRLAVPAALGLCLVVIVLVSAGAGAYGFILPVIGAFGMVAIHSRCFVWRAMRFGSFEHWPFADAYQLEAALQDPQQPCGT